ncbi:hypothetical protein C444_20726 [Haloarcula japonica DSM 6131]|uniref:Uncharacterized protein n=1 Tax=Haloarcula japonica (strain ATCC 49778 / DSM 6131 / JCM 7785 / NBRC 101032 / NCIMB 13157 / TR-1) TaxID=1227453 RepID=M0L253_HALJT|nr:hypothetical protein C444_20726 [Haloarcula japonica DSM 6131]
MLVLSLTVLSMSIAVFVTATGIASTATADTGYEFAIEDDALVETSGRTTDVLVSDIRTVNHIEITNLNRSPVVRATPREPPELSRSKRARAKRIITTDGPVADTVTSPADAVYTMRPVPRGVASERAAVVGADPTATWHDLATVNESAFTVRNGPTAGVVVIERVKQRLSDRRVLVVVDPIDRETRYSAVVDIRNERIDAFVRLRGVPE